MHQPIQQQTNDKHSMPVLSICLAENIISCSFICGIVVYKVGKFMF